MARMNSTIEATVRPIFQRTRLESTPKIFSYTDGLSGNGANATHNIIPGAGEIWAINYVKIISTANSGNVHYAKIQIVDGATARTIEMDPAMSAVGDAISFGSFGNGPLLITPNFYLRIYLFCETNSVTFDSVVSISKV